MKSFQEHSQTGSKLVFTKGTLPTRKSYVIDLPEAADPFNIAIVKGKDFDLIPNKPSADRGQLEKLLKQFSYVNSVPMAAQPSGKKLIM